MRNCLGLGYSYLVTLIPWYIYMNIFLINAVFGVWTFHTNLPLFRPWLQFFCSSWILFEGIPATKTLQMDSIDVELGYHNKFGIMFWHDKFWWNFKKKCCFWCLDVDIFHINLPLFKPWLKFFVHVLYIIPDASKTLQMGEYRCWSTISWQI